MTLLCKTGFVWFHGLAASPGLGGLVRNCAGDGISSNRHFFDHVDSTRVDGLQVRMTTTVVCKDECRRCVFEEWDLDAGIAPWSDGKEYMGFVDLAFFNEGDAILGENVAVVHDDNGDFNHG